MQADPGSLAHQLTQCSLCNIHMQQEHGLDLSHISQQRLVNQDNHFLGVALTQTDLIHWKYLHGLLLDRIAYSRKISILKSWYISTEGSTAWDIGTCLASESTSIEWYFPIFSPISPLTSCSDAALIWKAREAWRLTRARRVWSRDRRVSEIVMHPNLYLLASKP